LVEDDVNGMLVAPRDVDALRAAMLRLATDSDLAVRLSEAAARTGEAHRAGPWIARLRTWLSG
jgi:glycosyltransferase involved in cell wall biosynthesis